MFLIDTDHLSVIQRQADPDYSRFMNRYRRRPASAFFVSVVSFHEQVLGCNAFVQRSKTADHMARGYERFESILAYFAGAQVAAFDVAVARQFEKLRSQGVRIGAMDLRIAATALVNNYVVLTRNLVDFTKVPGLQVEDWTSAAP